MVAAWWLTLWRLTSQVQSHSEGAPAVRRSIHTALRGGDGALPVDPADRHCDHSALDRPKRNIFQQPDIRLWISFDKERKHSRCHETGHLRFRSVYRAPSCDHHTQLFCLQDGQREKCRTRGRRLPGRSAHSLRKIPPRAPCSHWRVHSRWGVSGALPAPLGQRDSSSFS